MCEAHTWEENVLFICKHEAEPTQLPEICGSPSPGESGFVQCNLRLWHKVTRHTLWNPWYPIYTWSTPNQSRLKLKYQRRWGQSRVKNKSLGDSIILTCTQTSDIPIKGAVCGRETFSMTLMPCCSYQLRLSRFGNKQAGGMSRGIWATSQKITSNQFSSCDTCSRLLCLHRLAPHLPKHGSDGICNIEDSSALLILIFKPKVAP